MNKYLAEFVGTFLLALAVNLSIAGRFPVPTPIVAALTLGVCVYTMWAISGTHINPAITIALAAIQKISVKDAGLYLVAQFAGGLAAMAVAGALVTRGTVAVTGTGIECVAEALGGFVLAYGVCSVVHGKAPGEASGVTIGGSLLIGISIAAPNSNGVLNPAVAVAIGSVSWTYLAGPVIGAVGAMILYRFLATD